MSRFKMLELADGTSVLSGLPRGLVMLSKLTSLIEHRDQPTVVFLDFAGVDVATSSYLRAGILGFRDQCVSMKSNLFPVMANVSPDTVDELKLALAPQGDAVFICDLGSGGKASNWQLIGTLDEKQKRTLAAVAEEGEVDASLLQTKHEDIDAIGTTGWNNRLTSLARRALLVEIQRGRAKRYRSVMEFA